MAAQFDDFSGVFVPYDHGNDDSLLGPVIPVINMDISATDCGLVDFYFYILETTFGLCDIFHPDTGVRFF